MFSPFTRLYSTSSMISRIKKSPRPPGRTSSGGNSGIFFRLKRRSNVAQLQLESAFAASTRQRERSPGVALVGVLEYISNCFTDRQNNRPRVFVAKTALASELQNHLPNQTKPTRVAGDSNLQFFGHGAGSAGAKKQPAQALDFSGHYINT